MFIDRLFSRGGHKHFLVQGNKDYLGDDTVKTN